MISLIYLFVGSQKARKQKPIESEDQDLNHPRFVRYLWHPQICEHNHLGALVSHTVLSRSAFWCYYEKNRKYKKEIERNRKILSTRRFEFREICGSLEF
jgi:hypothetical protein